MQFDFDHEGEEADEDLEQYMQTGTLPPLKSEAKAEAAPHVAQPIQPSPSKEPEEEPEDVQWKSHDQVRGASTAEDC